MGEYNKKLIYIIIFLVIILTGVWSTRQLPQAPKVTTASEPEVNSVNLSDVAPTETAAPITSKAEEEVASISGGLKEKATDKKSRSILTAEEINKFLPERGKFTFPAPYNTEGARITNSSDCGGTDCLNYVGYSYWSNMNNHVGSNNILIFLSLKKNGGPTLFSYSKSTGEVKKVGALFDSNSPYSESTAEGWYWSATAPSKLYAFLPVDSKLSRYDVSTKTFETIFDIGTQSKIFGSNVYIWQPHSSADDKVHSATVMDKTNYKDLGCMTYSEATKVFNYFPIKGIAYDECQIDKSGRWLVIKEKVEDDPKVELDNRIIDLSVNPPKETLFKDSDGAGGHSDLGFGYLVSADNFNNAPNAIRLWKLGTNPLGPGTIVYEDPDWLPGSMQHVSFQNARADVPIDQQYTCGSGANAINGPRTNEIACFKLDGSQDTIVVAPVMTDMNAEGGKDEYGKLPKGNLDVTGKYFIWTSNMGGDRLDAFIVKIPEF